MTVRFSRRRAMQASLAAATVAAVPGARTAARQATPAATGDASFSDAQVESALAQLDGMIETAMAQTGVPGVAATVVYNDTVVYERGFGVRDIGKPEPVTPETVFQLASMSKSISSTLMAALIGDGVTTWDAVASELDPSFVLSDSWMTRNVTIRDLFSHRSGMPAYAGDSLIGTFGYGREESVRRLRYIEPASSIRSTYAYTNLPLSVAGYAAARAAGQSWEDLADERLLRPLSMASTSYRYADYAARENRASPHYRTRNGAWALGEVTEADPTAPAGGVSSSVQDLTRWLRLLLSDGMFEGEQLVASSPLLETRRPQILEGSPPNPASGPALFYGLGWHVEYDQRGRLLVHHIGDFSAGFRTGVTLAPASGLGIVVLTNSWPNSLSDGIPKAFLDAVEYGEPTRDWVEVMEAATSASLAALAESTPFPAGNPPAEHPALPLDAYTGTYTNELYGDMTVIVDNEQLAAEIGPLPTRLTLRHWDWDTFTYPLPPSGEVLLGQLGVTFTIGPAGQASAAAFGLPTVGPDGTAMFTRIDPGA